MSVPPPISIAVLNDYEVVVTGLGKMLEPYSDRVVVVETLVDQPVSRPVDLALYDTFGRVRGQALGRDAALRTTGAERLVAYSWNTEPDAVEAALEGGADGYIGKQLSAAQLVEALERVHAGEQVRPEPTQADLVVDDEVDWPGRAEGLTAREAEVVALIVQGLSNVALAERVFLSVNTIKSYIRSAYRKMGVESRSQAVLWGIDHGFRRGQTPEVPEVREVLQET